MNIIRYDKKLKVMVECDNNRQFKLIRRSFKLLKMSNKLELDFNKEKKIITIQTFDEQTYNNIFDGIAHQLTVAARQGQIANVKIKNG